MSSSNADRHGDETFVASAPIDTPLDSLEKPLSSPTPLHGVGEDVAPAPKPMKRAKSSVILSEEMAMVIDIDREHFQYQEPFIFPQRRQSDSVEEDDENAPLDTALPSDSEVLVGGNDDANGGRRRRFSDNGVNARLLTEEDLDEYYNNRKSYSIPGYVANFCKKSYQNFNFKKSFLSSFPIIESAKRGYNLDFLQRDLLLGLTLAIITIPQGLAYSLLTSKYG